MLNLALLSGTNTVDSLVCAEGALVRKVLVTLARVQAVMEVRVMPTNSQDRKEIVLQMILRFPTNQNDQYSSIWSEIHPMEENH